MKKVLLGVAAVAMLGTVSCKKDYTCGCDYEVYMDYNSDWESDFFQDGVESSGSQEYDILDAKEDDAKSECEGYNGTDETTNVSGTQTTTYECTLSEK